MTTSDTILLLLADGKATTDSIANTLRQPAIVVASFCSDLEKTGLAVSAPLGDPAIGRKLAIWSITDAGKQRAQSLTASA